MHRAAICNVVLACLALGAPLPAMAEANVDLGKQDYEANCLICHGEDGKGQASPGIGMPDLTTLSARNGGEFPVARVYGVIDGRAELRAHGLRAMPIWGNYYSLMAIPNHTDYPQTAEAYVRSRIVALIDYLKRIQRQ